MGCMNKKNIFGKKVGWLDLEYHSRLHFRFDFHFHLRFFPPLFGFPQPLSPPPIHPFLSQKRPAFTETPPVRIPVPVARVCRTRVGGCGIRKGVLAFYGERRRGEGISRYSNSSPSPCYPPFFLSPSPPKSPNFRVPPLPRIGICGFAGL